MTRERKIIQDMIVPKKKQVDTPVVSHEKKDNPIIKEVPVKKYEPVVRVTENKNFEYKPRDQYDLPHKKSHWGIVVIIIVCCVVLTFVIGGLFTSATVIIEPITSSMPIDIRTTLNQSRVDGGLFFGTMTEDIIQETRVPKDSVESSISTLVLQVSSRIEMVRSRMINDIPESMMHFPLIIAEPYSVEQIDEGENILVRVHQPVTLILVDRLELATMIQKNQNTESLGNLIIASPEDMIATTTALVAAGSIPSSISVRITGAPVITGMIVPEDVKQLVVGKKLSHAKELLAEISEIASLDITMTPPWRRVMPAHTDEITVQIK